MKALPDKDQEYSFTNEQADALLAMCIQSTGKRARLLRRYYEQHGAAGIISLFANFIGMANSAIANNREMIELLLIIEGGMPPNVVEAANLPTIAGALHGVKLANSVNQKKTCGGCAYRLGAPANQSPVTTADAGWSRRNGTDFLCHEKLDENCQPYTLCRGYAQAVKGEAQ